MRKIFYASRFEAYGRFFFSFPASLVGFISKTIADAYKGIEELGLMTEAGRIELICFVGMMEILLHFDGGTKLNVKRDREHYRIETYLVKVVGLSAAHYAGLTRSCTRTV